MRHAFLVIAHNNWHQLKTLLSMLDYEGHDIYLHVDAKSKDFDQKYFQNFLKYSKLYIYQKYKVYWGGYVQVETELFLMKQAAFHKYDYYHIISGADLPLVTMRAFDAFFERNNGYEFVSFDDKKLHEDPEITRRTKYYHYLQNYRRRYSIKAFNSFFTFLERCLLVMQIIFHVNRMKYVDWDISYGSNWVSITHSLTMVVLHNWDKIADVFSYTNCADELFIQTVVRNCGFIKNIYPGKPLSIANCRLIDWERGGNGNPYTFRLDDYDFLTQERGFLFARKFSSTVDSEIIKKLCDNLSSK